MIADLALNKALCKFVFNLTEAIYMIIFPQLKYIDFYGKAVEA